MLKYPFFFLCREYYWQYYRIAIMIICNHAQYPHIDYFQYGFQEQVWNSTDCRIKQLFKGCRMGSEQDQCWKPQHWRGSCGGACLLWPSHLNALGKTSPKAPDCKHGPWASRRVLCTYHSGRAQGSESACHNHYATLLMFTMTACWWVF